MPPVEPIEVNAECAGRHANRHLDLADVVGPDADQRTTQSLVGLGLPIRGDG
jgi:hypothetical protein